MSAVDAVDAVGVDNPPPDPPPAPAPPRCQALTLRGLPCRRAVARGRDRCGTHASRGSAPPPQPPTEVPECPICLDPMTRRASFATACGHAFHARCLRRWHRARPLTCPLCRAVCLECLALVRGPRVTPKLQALVATVPPHPRAFFPAYIIAHLESTVVARALGCHKHLVELLVDLACECFTRDNFFAKLRAMAL